MPVFSDECQDPLVRAQLVSDQVRAQGGERWSLGSLTCNCRQGLSVLFSTECRKWVQISTDLDNTHLATSNGRTGAHTATYIHFLPSNGSRFILFERCARFCSLSVEGKKLKA